MEKSLSKPITIALISALFLGYFAPALSAPSGSGIYNNHCSRCHGDDGRGGVMPGVPNFTRGEGLRKNNRSLIVRIQDGKNACPSYRGILSEPETLNVVKHLRTFY